MKALKIWNKGLAAIAISTLLFSCEGFHEAIIPLEIEVDDVETVIVINAEIEMEQTAWVQISYSEDVDAHAETSVWYEENASIQLTTTTGETEELKYNTDGLYYGRQIHGEVGETYTLTIEIEGISYSAKSTMLPPPGYQNGWVTPKEDKGVVSGYSDEWIVNDPSDRRNRYLFEWWTNGWHRVRQDWAIDDNRVVNANEGLRLFNVTTDPGENEYTVLRAAEIDKLTYDYYNMYEKIVRGLVSVESQTPYNPVSNFGQGSMGNFRAVAFSSIVLLTPPSILAEKVSNGVEISFPLNKYFNAYNLFWQKEPVINKDAEVVQNISFSVRGESGVYVHQTNTTDTLYYRIEVEDDQGNTSVLSPEVSSVGVQGRGGPTNVTASSGKGQITLSWDGVEGVAGYGVYWSTKSGVSEQDKFIYDQNNPFATTYTHTGLKSGVTYYYRIAAFFGDKGENKEVVLSEEVSAIPD